MFVAYELRRFRDEHDPYTNVFDCVRRIIAEEGLQTFFRGWWVSLLASVIPAIGLAIGRY